MKKGRPAGRPFLYRAILPLAFQAKRRVEPAPEILLGHNGRELDELRLAVDLSQSGEEIIGHVRRRGRHRVGELKGYALPGGEEITRRINGEGCDLGVGGPFPAAPGSVAVRSVGATDDRRDAGIHQAAELLWDATGREDPGVQLAGPLLDRRRVTVEAGFGPFRRLSRDYERNSRQGDTLPSDAVNS